MNDQEGERIAIIGAGISGLSTAVALINKGVPGELIQLFDQNSDAGGILQTETAHGCRIEKSADMFSTKTSAALDLCRLVGFEEELISTNSENRGAALATPEDVSNIPTGFSLIKSTLPSSVIGSNLLSKAGKLRFLLEPLYAKLTPQLVEGQELSVKDFATFHWGKEVFEKIVQPLVSGIYTADPSKLSMKAALGEFFDQGIGGRKLLLPAAAESTQSSEAGIQAGLEFENSSSTSNPSRVAQAETDSKGARYGLFLAPKKGMGSFTKHLQSWLMERKVRFCLGSPVLSVQKSENKHPGWNLRFSFQNQNETQRFSKVVFAIPAAKSTNLISEINPALSKKVSQIPYASIAIVIAGYKREAFKNNGKDLKFGLVVPHYLGSPLIATSFASQKFQDRSPSDLVLTRSFIGGALNPDALNLSDQEILATSHQQLNRWFPLNQDPAFQFVVRYPSAMPQYHIGHEDLVNEIFKQEASMDGIYLAGNAYRGVGIPQCIQSGFDAADRIIRT